MVQELQNEVAGSSRDLNIPPVLVKNPESSHLSCKILFQDKYNIHVLKIAKIKLKQFEI